MQVLTKSICPEDVEIKAENAIKYCKSAVMEVKTQEQANNANEFLKRVKSDHRFLEDSRVALKAPLLQQTRELDAIFKQYTDPLLRAERQVKAGLSLFLLEEQKKQREAEQKALLRAKEEEDRQRLALEARAGKAEEKGNAEKAEILREQAEAVHVTAIITHQPTKLSGSSLKMKTVAVIEDITAIPPAFYLNNQAVIDAIQKVMNTFASSKMHIAGIRYEDVPAIATRI